jgi:glycolate oxidase FAD binding subunit
MSSRSERASEIAPSSSLFSEVLAPEQIVDPGDLALDGVPVSAILQPASAEQVAACLGLASRQGAAVIPRGGGTRLGWGNLPRARTVALLDLARLTQRLEIVADEGIATASAGVRAAELERQAVAAGRRTTLGAVREESTLGGVVASDPLGCDFTPDRSLRADLLGMEVALANGSLARCGARVVKNVTGFDLVRLYCGSLGSLGVITEVTLRLRPLPRARRVCMRTRADLRGALEVARQLAATRIPHAGVVAMPDGRLLWVLEGAEEEVDALAQRFPGDPAPPRAWEDVRELRVRQPDEGRACVRVSARPSDGLTIWERILTWASEAVAVLALPAAGTLLASCDPGSLPAILAGASTSGWAAFVESAPASFKTTGDVFGAAPALLPLARALKQRFDPEGVLSPGRFQGRI